MFQFTSITQRYENIQKRQALIYKHPKGRLYQAVLVIPDVKNIWYIANKFPYGLRKNQTYSPGVPVATGGPATLISGGKTTGTSGNTIDGSTVGSISIVITGKISGFISS